LSKRDIARERGLRERERDSEGHRETEKDVGREVRLQRLL
jgi:hypothetical protein